MLVSVVVITYNHEKYIEETIESILMQRGEFEIEILIGNDNSPDNTKEILEKYSTNNKIKIINREKNIGATRNLLDLLLKSQGEYIAILEGDDYWTDELKISKQLKILEKDKGCILCYTDSDIINKKYEIIGKKSCSREKISNLVSMFINMAGIPTGSILFKNIFKENLEIEKIKKLLTSGNLIGDLSLYACLIKYGTFKKLKEVTGIWRVITEEGATSYTSRKDLYKKLELYKVTSGIKEYYQNDNKLYLKLLVERRKYELLKEIKKANKKIEEFGIKKSSNSYSIMKPIYDLILSCYKRRYQ